MPRVVTIENIDQARTVVRFDNGRSVTLARDSYKKWLATDQRRILVEGAVRCTVEEADWGCAPDGGSFSARRLRDERAGPLVAINEACALRHELER